MAVGAAAEDMKNDFGERHRQAARRRTVRIGVAVALALALAAIGGVGLLVYGRSKSASPKLGLWIDDPRASPGYTLLATLLSTDTHLIDMQGKVVRTWKSDCNPGWSAYLLENGHLLRAGLLGPSTVIFGGGPGAGGRVQEFTWEGELVWDYQLFNQKQLPHHDVAKLPNGNVLLIVWDKRSVQQSLAAGRRPEIAAGRRPEIAAALGPDVSDACLLPDSLVEIKPIGKTTGQVVWEWRVWDHLVQDFDPSKPNYGDPADHPELIDINYHEDALGPVMATKDGADKLRSIGYVGSTPRGKALPLADPDWTHVNSVAYHRGFDQIVVSVLGFSEFWIIDHSTTTAEAAGHRGGRRGNGGDLLYRWGNPRAYRAGTKADQRLFGQHSADWIAPGLPGEGHVLVFNNGRGRPDGSYSSVDEIAVPVDARGRYPRNQGAAFGPDAPVWSYTAPQKSDFLDYVISGAQRLPNGDTLICSGVNGVLFEVTPEKEVVWKYVNPTQPGRDPGIAIFFPNTAMLARGPDGFRGPGAAALFRAYRYAPDFPGLAGKDLTPGKTIEALQSPGPEEGKGK
jgi:hypothetical protein